jgi:hypothetical protein
MKKIVNLSLPEIAFIDGSEHEKENVLSARTVIIHTPTGIITEVVHTDDAALDDDVIQLKFIYHGVVGDERLTIALHRASSLYNKDEILEVMRRCADWYCDYAQWEDANILNNENLEL